MMYARIENGTVAAYPVDLQIECPATSFPWDWPGGSAVGSYTGNGSTLSVDCGFAAGARFLLIKRSNSATNWYIWDTARGISSGNDPHLIANTNALEASTDSIGPNAVGFDVIQNATTNINVSGAPYVYLAIA